MRKLTLYLKDVDVGCIMFNNGKYTTYATRNTLREALNGLLDHGIYCRRYENLEEIEKGIEPRMIYIDTSIAKADFLEQVKLYLESSFDFTCTITEE